MNILNFLSVLASDPEKLSAYNEDPNKAMDIADLSEDDRKALLSKDQGKIHQRMIEDRDDESAANGDEKEASAGPLPSIAQQSPVPVPPQFLISQIVAPLFHIVTPQVVPQIVPQVVTPQVVPQVVTRQVAPQIVPQVVTPQVVPQIVPQVVAPQVVPQIVPQVVTPQVVPQIVPQVVTPQAAPLIVPQVVTPQVVPQIVPQMVSLVPQMVITPHLVPPIFPQVVFPNVHGPGPSGGIPIPNLAPLPGVVMPSMVMPVTISSLILEPMPTTSVPPSPVTGMPPNLHK